MPEEPDWKHEIARRLAGLNLPPERESEIIDELSGHLHDDYRHLLAGGASDEEAIEIVLDELNERPPLTEAVRAVESPAHHDPIVLGTPQSSAAAELGRDVKYALRTLKRSPGFTALAVLSLALGIGGNAAMFGVVSAALLRPLPYADPDRLVHAVSTGYYPPGGLVALQQESRTMELAGYNPAIELNLTGSGEPWRVRGSSVSANLFHVLGVSMALGRGFQTGEDEAGRDDVVILSQQLWQDYFRRDPGVLDRVVMLGGVPRRVIGVASPGFTFPDAATRFWIPLHLDPSDPAAYWARGFMPVLGRLRPGATLSQAQHEIAALSMQMLRLFPYSMGRDWAASMSVAPLRRFLTADIRTRLLVLQCAVVLVLLIAAANFAGLSLARAASRQKEIALRVAVGASRARIVRQLLTESVVLSLVGGLLGVALAFGAHSTLETLVQMPNSVAIAPGWQVLAGAGALALFTGVIFGLIPALVASRQDLALAIRTGGQRAAGVGRAHLRSALVVVEVALAVVLTVGAGLLIRSLWRLAQVNPGFRPEHVLTLRVSPNQSLCAQRDACIALYDELLRRTRAIPGVEDDAIANALPMGGVIPGTAVVVEGVPYVPAERTAPVFWAGAVTPNYFRLMSIPIRQGRPLEAADGEHSEPVIVVSAATARRYWPKQNPIGKHVRMVWEDRWRRVIGVAGDVRQFDLAGRSPDFIRGSIYMPYTQAVNGDRQLPAVMMLIVRTNADTAGVVSGIRQLVRQLNPNVPVDDVRTMVSLVNESTEQPRSMMGLFIGFAAVALLLAAVGTYGVVSYSTAQRTFEIGVRMALGAEKRSIFGLVLGQSLRLVLVGLAIGLTASVALTRLLGGFLYRTAATDPATFAAVSCVLLVVALLAGYMPARRAVGIDPLLALRAD